MGRYNFTFLLDEIIFFQNNLQGVVCLRGCMDDIQDNKEDPPVDVLAIRHIAGICATKMRHVKLRQDILLFVGNSSGLLFPLFNK